MSDRKCMTACLPACFTSTGNPWYPHIKPITLLLQFFLAIKKPQT